MILSFSIFLAFFILVGLWSARVAQSTNKDYLVAGRNVSPWLAALSAVSTNNSGYMFIGQIGFTYMAGLSSIWLMIGWVFGDFLISMFVHKRFREVAGKNNILSFSGMISNWWDKDFRPARAVAGVITILFLGTYAAAQFKAGGKALNVLLNWHDYTGIVIGAVMVMAYCFAGGLRASIWTDAAQSFAMIIAMGILLFFVVDAAGGWVLFFEKTAAVSPAYTNWFPENLPLGPFAGPMLFVMGWVFAGFGIIGQPHIMVRMMSLDTANSVQKFRLYYYSWYIVFYLAAIGVGLASRVLLPESNSFDPELALPTLALQLLPDILIGVIIAGIFAATMSTADSQILSCTAAFTRDLLPKPTGSYWLTKSVTIMVTVGATILALYGGQNVFNLVLIAWSVLGSAFAPILILYAFNQRISQPTLITMMLVGVGTTMVWRHFELQSYIYEVAPGILSGFLVFGLFKMRALVFKNKI